MQKYSPEENFNNISQKKLDLIQVPRSLQQYTQFMDYKIRKQFKSFTILSLCGAERGQFAVENQFVRAFENMTTNQKIEYYGKYVEMVLKQNEKWKSKSSKESQTAENEDQSKQFIHDATSIPIKVGKSFKSSEENHIVINNLIAKWKGKAQFQIDFRNYLIRKSKKKDELGYILQAIRDCTPEIVRFFFTSKLDLQKHVQIILECTQEGCRQNIESHFALIKQSKKPDNFMNPERQFKLKTDNNFLNDEIINIQRNDSVLSLNKSVIGDIIKKRDDQQYDDELEDLIDKQNEALEMISRDQRQSKGNSIYTKFNTNVFKIILPTYPLELLDNLNHYGSIYESKISQLYVYQNSKNPLQFKMKFTVDLPLHIACKAIYNVQLYKNWHTQIDEGQIKMKVTSENSCIMYLKAAAFSEWYKERDYLLLAHMFRLNNTYYIVQKSIQNSNFIPFQSVTRGNFELMVWKIEPHQKQDKSVSCKITVHLQVDHGGLLNKHHQKDLTLRFLKGFQLMSAYYKNPINLNRLTDILTFQWSITDEKQTNPHSVQDDVIGKNASLMTLNFQDEGEEISQQEQSFYSIEDPQDKQTPQNNQDSDHEVEPINQNIAMQNSQFTKRAMTEDIKTDNEGIIALPCSYLKKKHFTNPFECERNVIDMPFDNIVEKDDWRIDKNGGLKLINQKKIDAQNNVLKFIMKTLKKNLFSGKGILSISLPVEIFNVDSNLQRTCQAMTLGPEFLQRAAKSVDPLERFKHVLAFGLSNTIIYFDVEKPFNPILGETYQGFIRGCPIYAQQISHHPPITTVYMVGRGYKVTASLQAKVNIHMNSGDGINQGFIHVIFDDGQQVCFQTPPGQLSGLAMGQRGFNVKGKGLYIDKKNNIFCEMKVENSGGLFGKKKQFIDEIEGDVLKVKSGFIDKFLNAPIQKKPTPTSDDIIEKVGQLSGRWPFSLKIDNKIYYNIRSDLPDKLIDDIYPLNSNSNYREDLFYRKKNDLVRSQIEKERLEVLQRGDRKLRQKFHGKSH